MRHWFTRPGNRADGFTRPGNRADWPLAMLLCACAPTPPPSPPIEPEHVEIEAPRPASITDAHPLDPEIAAEPKRPAPDPRTPAERARDVCQAYCDREFDRDRLIRRLTEAKWRTEHVESLGPCHHGCPPDLEDEDGHRRFFADEPSTLWWWSNRMLGGVVLFINPIPERIDFPFTGTLIEIDEQNRVLRCRHVDRDEPMESVDMTCST
jgi:hypothetical protein